MGGNAVKIVALESRPNRNDSSNPLVEQFTQGAKEINEMHEKTLYKRAFLYYHIIR